MGVDINHMNGKSLHLISGGSQFDSVQWKDYLPQGFLNWLQYLNLTMQFR